jgi:hypothetical protein
MEKNRLITVTSPLLPNLDDFNEMLHQIWSSKWITNNGSFHKQLGKELADVIHYVVAIAAVNDLDLNGIILEKDKMASLKYNHDTNMEQFVLEKRASD